MIKLDPPTAKNSKTLKAVTARSTEISPLLPVLRASYAAYWKNGGDPARLTPISGLSDPQKDKLKELYASAGTEAVKNLNELNWIYYLRHNHSLSFCPMCGNTGAGAVDHYLAKEDYPEFSILTFNLIPTCDACNSKRGNHANKPKTPLALLHPYFDGVELNSELIIIDISGEKDAQGKIQFSAPSFKVIPNIPSSHKLYYRLINHLDKNIHASRLRNWLTGRWKAVLSKANSSQTYQKMLEKLSNDLADEIAAGGTNNWTAAFLRGVLKNQEAATWIWNNRGENIID